MTRSLQLGLLALIILAAEGAPVWADMPGRRSGPFRSCGSGMSTGLAGVALAWGALWLGGRCAARVSRAPKAERND